MARKPLEISKAIGRDAEAKYIAMTWFNYNSQRFAKIEEWKELRNFIFATDTTKTSNKKLPWKNSTTLPKLCQIRDNLHSNYVSALFPNDNWLKWEAYSLKDAAKNKASAIEAYMANKTRTSHFRSEMSKCLYDYIDTGNAFCMPVYEASYVENELGEKVPDYIGPRAYRISPYDIVFNPLAASFKDSFKIIRSFKTLGELKIMADSQPDNAWLHNALKQRSNLFKNMNGFVSDSFDKQEGFLVDGYGNYFEYLQSGYVEVLSFYGDIHNQETGEIETGVIIDVIDRAWVISKRKYPSWLGHAPIYHVGWRTRPDNLWAMGPLDNLVGMQYRLDHLENAKADAFDLGIAPPLVIAGEVEQFNYEPFGEIHIDENGSVTELGKNLQFIIQADNQINMLTMMMEQFAGAPSEAMGIRTPGEKTAFEVGQLQNAAGRIFQEKINHFEMELLEPTLNGMLECSRRNMDNRDVVQVIDDDLGVTSFMEITKEDITASGVIRPVGARHFAAQAQLMQNITQLFNTQVMQFVAPHTSGKNLAALIENVLQLEKFQLFQPNVAIFEQQETAQLANQAQEDVQMTAAVNPSTGIVE